MNGMQQVSTWNLLDVVPITAGATYDPTLPALVQLAAGPNQWAVSVRQGGVEIDLSTQLYGELSGQFSELA